MTTYFSFAPNSLPGSTQALREEIRSFLDQELSDYPAVKRAETWMGYDKAFSKKMGDRGWLGMTWPKQYGGHERSAFERYVVLEEMLAAGAPVGAHWIGDRQSGPLLLRFGTEKQREEILPRVARGEIFFCIGMSEPDSGSDLAATKTRAQKTDGGWLINGTKLWSTGAQHADYMIALFRTESNPESRHGGLSQFLVDLKTPGITVRPIKDLSGAEHFNEVVFEDAFVGDDWLVGEEGGGWAQVTAELAYERSGPERYMSCMPLLTELVREIGPDPDERQAIILGKLIARLATLRQMSISVAGMLEDGKDPALEASIVKDQGALFEQSLPHIANDLIDGVSATGTDYAQVLNLLVQISPSFSLRGGTREILRGIIARGLGLR